ADAEAGAGSTGTAAAAAAATPTAGPAAEAATGVLQLAVSPWAEVEIDGQVVGITPPLRQLSLAPGRHTVRLRNGAFAPHVATVQVGTDETSTLHHRFGP
ncbi:PEGA domain-containing protein, partial [Methylibium sp.]|uniref:PEGA domain-containing protein n=1 Tax=Methylibium sp. TaxID=2067992 RepID=UPI00183505C5